jgi:hypothetical protein
MLITKFDTNSMTTKSNTDKFKIQCKVYDFRITNIFIYWYWVLTQGLSLARQALLLLESLRHPFFMKFFSIGSPELFAWGWL